MRVDLAVGVLGARVVPVARVDASTVYASFVRGAIRVVVTAWL